MDLADDTGGIEVEPGPSNEFHENSSIIITNFKLTSKEDLLVLLELEEKTLIPKYNMNRNLMESSDRACLSRVIIKNLLKADPQIE